ncbi:hypothetical protein ACI2S5_24270 [Ralstonia nicotianae]|uniref:hypothetical protein n=1 Tax=Ralstonia solanacearum species complex TaxID=3116862 RepID=UPI0012FE032B|nr:hypothetical protein [Ralstonia solanacearum]BEU65734.1 hypothetical protein MAFF301069_02890 [Ralstonia pseudosolanacearum]NKA67705.1 hypothetical protein [Ralstonia solanacearum]NKA86001.1 hypothetical protein [Ralstonia solanacearum]NKF57678.1 hypothetical protein [Ralstonia solanacearum]
MLSPSRQHEPGFSESQLQQAVNGAFVRRVAESHGPWLFPVVPSLYAEFDLGWDTAFHLPWLPHPPARDHEGCNFFIQYKLSGELKSRGAKEWNHWREPYFRFKIPHRTRDESGNSLDDYHQWDRLKALANRDYPTFYATNSTLSRRVLQNAWEANTLLDQIPLLDVRTVNGQHRHVTFTVRSGAFLLHSETEEVKKLSFKNTLNRLAEIESQILLSRSTKKLLNDLEELGEGDENWALDLDRLRAPPPQQIPQQINPWFQYTRLMWFVRKHLSADLLWLPR